MVLLSDPFQELAPRLANLENLDLSDLEAEMEALSFEMQDLAGLQSLEILKELGGLNLEGLAELGGANVNFDLSFDGLEDFDIETIETEDGMKIIIPNREITVSRLDGKAFNVKVEQIAAMAEAHAERAEAQAERAAEIFESRMEEKADRMEMLGDRMEARVEAAFEGGLEEDLEDAGNIVESLAEQCEDRDERLTEPTIITARGDGGQTYRALCVNGSRERLADSDVTAFVEKHPALSEAEKERFGEARSFDYKYQYSRTDD